MIDCDLITISIMYVDMYDIGILIKSKHPFYTDAF